jgi:hypothetical protein
VDSSFDYLDFGSFITPEQNEIRLKLRQFLEAEVRESIIPYIEAAKFPEYLIPKFR